MAIADARNPTPRRGLLSSGIARGAGLVLAAGLLVLIAFASLAFGAKPMPLSDAWNALFNFDGTVNNHLIVRDLRIPRTLLGLGAGAALGAAGAVMQGLTRNPLADPGILGVNAGASLGVVLGIYSFGVGSFYGYIWIAFAGALLAALAVASIGSMGRGGATPAKLALAGAAIHALLASFTAAILLSDEATLDVYRFWAVGSLAGKDTELATQVLPVIAIGLVLAVAAGGPLNLMALGEDVARSLGQRVGTARALSMAAIVVLCGAATAVCGPIGFIGLTIPHIARSICGPNYRWIIPWSIVLAPVLLLGSDIVGRLIARPGELQVGLVTAFIGAPFFIALVRRKKLAEL